MSDHAEPTPNADEPKKPKFKLPPAVQAALGALFLGLKVGFVGAMKAPLLIRDGLVESLKGLRSKDQPTRRASRFFIVSLVLLTAVIGLLGKYGFDRVMEIREKNLEEQRRVTEAFHKAEEEKKRNRPPSYFSLGSFSLELKEEPGVVLPKNSSNSAEFEIVVQCDEPELCEWVSQHVELARGELSSLFVPTSREKLLSVSGKKAFREEIRDVLNRWLETQNQSGQILDILFPRFILS